MIAMCVVGNKGAVYILQKKQGFNWLQFWDDVFPIQARSDFVNLVLKGAEKYGFHYYEIKNR